MRINWLRAAAGAVIGEIALVAAAFLWVAIYSYLINPGQEQATYEAYALVASPWVALIAGIPIFFLVSRWIARTRPTALALFAVFLLIDVALFIALTEEWAGLPFALITLSYLTKLAACALGGRRA